MSSAVSSGVLRANLLSMSLNSLPTGRRKIREEVNWRIACFHFQERYDELATTANAIFVSKVLFKHQM